MQIRLLMRGFRQIRIASQSDYRRNCYLELASLKWAIRAPTDADRVLWNKCGSAYCSFLALVSRIPSHPMLTIPENDSRPIRPFVPLQTRALLRRVRALHPRVCRLYSMVAFTVSLSDLRHRNCGF